MGNITLLIENQTLQIVFAVVVFLIIFGFLGIRVVPKNFNQAQVIKILKTASFSANIIGLVPILIVFYFFFEDWYLWGLDKFDQKILLVVIAISLPAFIAAALFKSTKSELEKKNSYQQLGMQYKIIAGFALLVGVVVLPSIKFFNKEPLEFDFYSEQDDGLVDEELEHLEPE